MITMKYLLQGFVFSNEKFTMWIINNPLIDPPININIRNEIVGDSLGLFKPIKCS